MDHRAGRYISFATLYEDYACRYTSIEAIMYSPQVSPLYFLSERLILYLYTPHWTKKVHHFSLCSAAIIGAFMTVCNGQPMRCTYIWHSIVTYMFSLGLFLYISALNLDLECMCDGFLRHVANIMYIIYVPVYESLWSFSMTGVKIDIHILYMQDNANLN